MAYEPTIFTDKSVNPNGPKINAAHFNRSEQGIASAHERAEAARLEAGTKAPAAHDHDGRYYTEAEVNDLFAARDALRDPVKTARIRDEFAGGSTANGSIGDLGWTYGAGLILLLAAPMGRVGVIQRHTNATVNTYCYTIPRSVSSGLFHSSNAFDSTWMFRLNTNNAETLLRIGFMDGAVTNPPANGIYLEKLADANTNWYAVAREGNIETRTSLGAASTNWTRLRMRRVDAVTVAFSINDGAEVSRTENIPAMALLPNLAILSTTVNTKSVDIDYFDLLVTGLNR